MSLRRRLVLAFTLLLLTSLVVFGFVATSSTRSVLQAQADASLRSVQARVNDRPVVGQRDSAADAAGNTADRGFATIVLDEDGEVVVSLPSGFPDASDSLPSLDRIDDLLADPQLILTVQSEDGSVSYRALAVIGRDGHTALLAVPIDGIDAANAELARLLLLGGTAVAVTGAGATWWIVRKGLEPVDAMVETAAAIADGDLTRRVSDDARSTELGRLGAALNEMLTQLDHAFTQEQASQERLNQFVADASHELRTPLATLQGYTHLYRAGALQDPAELDAAMERIRKESSRMNRLVDDLLLLARLDRGQPLAAVPVDLAAIIGDTIANAHAIEPERSVTYEGPTKLVINGDENRLAQVLTNLIANARNHTPEGTPIEVVAANNADHVTVEVMDSGSGIPDDQLHRIFDRFSQLEPSQANAGGGAGLGLAIVSAIVGAHNGSVSAANRPNGGALFSVFLPNGGSGQ